MRQNHVANEAQHVLVGSSEHLTGETMTRRRGNAAKGRKGEARPCLPHSVLCLPPTAHSPFSHFAFASRPVSLAPSRFLPSFPIDIYARESIKSHPKRSCNGLFAQNRVFLPVSPPPGGRFRPRFPGFRFAGSARPPWPMPGAAGRASDRRRGGARRETADGVESFPDFAAGGGARTSSLTEPW